MQVAATGARCKAVRRECQDLATQNSAQAGHHVRSADQVACGTFDVITDAGVAVIRQALFHVGRVSQRKQVVLNGYLQR